MDDRVEYVQTVLGRIRPTDIGICQPHEHILLHIVPRDGSPAKSKEDLERWDQPNMLENYYDVRRYKSLYRGNQSLDDVSVAIKEVSKYRQAGGGTLVEVTSIGLGRRPQGLLEVSKKAGVHIVMGCAHYTSDFHPPGLAEKSAEEIRDEILVELYEGVTGVFPGIIGEVGLSWPIHPVEERVLLGAVLAQKVSGYPVTVHPGRHSNAPLEIMRIADANGADLEKIIIGHLDRTLFDKRDFLALAETGCYLEFDLFGNESSYYDLAPIDMPNDATRLNHIAHLCDRGFVRRILMSQDICMKAHLRSFGGEGYDHLLKHVVPLMLRKGFGTALVDQLLMTNPREMLTLGG